MTASRACLTSVKTSVQSSAHGSPLSLCSGGAGPVDALHGGSVSGLSRPPGSPGPPGRGRRPGTRLLLIHLRSLVSPRVGTGC